MLNFCFSETFEKILFKIKNKKELGNIHSKIRQIVSLEDYSKLNYFKNLRAPLNNYKRVHINTSFVLIFRYLKEENTIIFQYHGHHDEVYKKL